ncbi:MAG: C25 family cysteine peptidase [candidate division Zixibacteria bacterium]|nr:C25 family cysteine peptidase [candidate division Zixibacteria bacterium]
MAKKFFLSCVVLSILHSFCFSQSTYQVNFSEEELQFQKKGNYDYIQLKKGESEEEIEKPVLPFRIFNLLIPENKVVDTVLCETENEKLLGNYFICPGFRKEKTDGMPVEDLPVFDSTVYFSDEVYPQEPYKIISSDYLEGNHILSLALYPLKYFPKSQNLLLNKSLKLTIILKEAPSRRVYPKIGLEEKNRLSAAFLGDLLYNPEELPQYSRTPEYKAGASDQPVYLIITSEELRNSFFPLIEWKTQKGLRAKIVTTDSIMNSCSGRDLQEKTRNFLIQSYPDGLLWILLGGDGDIVPFRYAYHANTSSPIPIIDQQICDLYYADLDGDWDKDGDGVYGEPTDDSPDLYPELFVGRAPVKTPEEADVFVQKIINYEKNPGSGDYSFLKKALWLSSDQMRDWETVGQHTLVSQQVDQSFFQDLQSLVESPSGSAENPTDPSGSKCIEVLNQGWGIIGVFAHGKSNGFVASSNLINQWPKSCVYSDSNIDDGNGHLNNLNNSNKLGIIYSISCDQTALDVETEPTLGTPPCIGKSFLISKDKGAVAFLGYSRWGWVSTSYKLASEFMKNLFKPEYEYHIGIAEAFSKTAYSIYRDLNYGHNLLGDPEMQIWTEVPCSLEVNYPYDLSSDSIFIVQVKVKGLPLPDAKVVVSQKDTLFFTGITGQESNTSIPLLNLRPGEVNLTVTKHNFLPFEAKMNLSAKSDVKDSDKGLDLNLSLGLNYPNPFNPSTTIPFKVGSLKSGVGSPLLTSLKIYNILGQLVRTLVNDEKLPGNYQVIWDGKDQRGNLVSSGIYFYQLRAGDYQETKKMSLVR